MPSSSDVEDTSTTNGLSGEESNVPKSQFRSSPLWNLKYGYLCVFVDFLGLGLCIPILPFFSMSLGATPAEVGAVLGLFSVGQMFGSLVLGKVSDRIGRRPVIICSIFASCACYVVHSLVADLTQLLVVRFISGLCAGTLPVVQAMILDSVHDYAQIGKCFGMMGAAIGLAFIVGPAIGSAATAVVGFKGAFLVGAAPSLLFGFLAILRLQETLPKNKPDGLQQQQTALVGPSWPRIANLVLVAMFLNAWSIGCMNSMAGLLWKDLFAWGSNELGGVLAVVGLFEVLIQAFAAPRLIKLLGANRVNNLGSVIMGFGTIVHSFIEVDWTHLMLFSPIVVGWGLIMPSSPAVMGEFAQPAARGAAMGANAGAMSLGRTLAPFVSGALYGQDEILGHSSLPFSYSPFVLAAVFNAVACLCCLAVAPFASTGSEPENKAVVADEPAEQTQQKDEVASESMHVVGASDVPHDNAAYHGDTSKNATTIEI